MKLIRALLTCILLSAFGQVVAGADVPVRRVDIHVQKGRPIAGERSRFAVAPDGTVVLTYTVAGARPEEMYLPYGIIKPDGAITLHGMESETTWNVEGWGTYGWPFDLAWAGPGDLRYVVRYHGRPYGACYWRKEGGRWKAEVFGANVSHGGNNMALGLLPGGKPVVVSLGRDRSQLLVWERSDEGDWRFSKPAELSRVQGGDFDAVIVGHALKVIFCSGGGAPSCATRGRDGKWSVASLDKLEFSMMVTAAADAAGRVHAAYAAGSHKDSLRQLRHSVYDGAQWRAGTVADAPEGRHVGRTDISVASGKTVIAWELGPGPVFRTKDYGNKVGGVMLTVIDAAGKATTHELVKLNGGRPSVALSPDGRTAYVGVYTGNDADDNFYILGCGLDGAPAPDLKEPAETSRQILAEGCLNEIRSGNPAFARRGMSRIDMSMLKADQRNRLIERFLEADEMKLRYYAARELARSPDAAVKFAGRIREILNDPSPAVRQSFFAHLKTSPESTKAIIPVLLESLKSEAPINRLGAAEALRKLRSPVDAADFETTMKTLAAGLADRDRSTGGSAAVALMLLMELSPTEKIVRAALQSDDPYVRSQAAKILFRGGKPFDVSGLASVLDAEDEAAQLNVCGVLARMRSAEGIPLLREALAGRFASVRTAAVFALRSTGLLGELQVAAVRPSGLKVRAIRVTGKGTPEEEATRGLAVKALMNALSASDPNVREKACNALNRIKATEALSGLKQLVDDPDAGVRNAARIAVSVLGGRPSSDYLVDLDAWRKAAPERKAPKLNDVFAEPTQVKDGVVQIAGRKQLFVDDFLIAERLGVERRLHSFKRHPRNPVFEAQAPWEEGWADPFMSTVLYDPEERCFKLWYRCGPRHSLGGYAVSEDGIHWARPNIARSAWQEWTDHNLLAFGDKVALGSTPGHNVILREDRKDPERRYSTLCYRHDKQYIISYSPDGVAWSEAAPVRRAYGDVVSVVWDPGRQRYLFFPKYMRNVDGFVRRSFGAALLKDFKEITAIEMPFVATLEQDGVVASSASRSYWSLLPGLLSVPEFHAQIYSVTAIPYEGVVMALYDLWPIIGNKEGSLDMPMKVSRDMVNWTNVNFPDRALSVGRFGEWDAGMVYGGNTMLVVNDEIRLYYLGANMGHCTRVLPMHAPWHAIGVGLATLRLDGFVSLRAADVEGVATTKPLSFRGAELIVNADCSKGALRVEILDRAGNPIPGFTREDCAPFRGNALRHRMSWRGKSEVSSLAGKPVRLRFHLRAGDLYALQFR